MKRVAMVAGTMCIGISTTFAAWHNPAPARDVCARRDINRRAGIDSTKYAPSDPSTRPLPILPMMSPALASILAGSAAGAIGVGVAFPLDTLKTKSQVLGKAFAEKGRNGQGTEDNSSGEQSPGAVNPAQLGMLGLIALIWEAEGIAGFFGGVRGMMVGQGFIKATAFSANSYALAFLEEHSIAVKSVATLLLAASFSGFVTSFLVAPVERIKIMQQASDGSQYSNELDCLQAVVDSEGLGGLFGRGLGPTLAREVPSYAIYFAVYGALMQTQEAQVLGWSAPLVFGAMSGCACWIPVYPIDVVKTLIQNTEGGEEQKNAVEVARELFEERGVGAFFDGLTPKMLRAAVNHSVTFFCYDLAMQALAPQSISGLAI